MERHIKEKLYATKIQQIFLPSLRIIQYSFYGYLLKAKEGRSKSIVMQRQKYFFLSSDRIS